MRAITAIALSTAILAIAFAPSAAAHNLPVQVDPTGCSGVTLGADFGVFVCNDLDGSSGCHSWLVYVTIAGPIQFCLVP